MTISQTQDVVASANTNREFLRIVMERLTAERAAQLADDAARPVVEYEQQATTGSGETDYINVEMERQLVAALDGHARQAREEVRLALARLDEGTYGRCERCGVTIDVERLLALPRVAFCIDCQRTSESR